jgi:hypothetical protein
MAALHRNNVSLGAKRSTNAAHGISEPGNGEATDDTSYGAIFLTARPLVIAVILGIAGAVFSSLEEAAPRGWPCLT